MTQNVFFRNDDYRHTSLNTHYMFIFKLPRDMSQFNRVASQVYPRMFHFLINVYNNELEEDHAYMLLDFKPRTPKQLRVRGPIGEKYTKVFVPEITFPKNKNIGPNAW